MDNYDKIYKNFEDRGCKLLNTREEVINIKKAKGHPKYNYIAKCGHEHVVFYNVFTSRNTGIICPKCKCIENGKEKKEAVKDNKLNCLNTEFECIKYFIEKVKHEFQCIKAFDCCKADMILKPISINEDKWIGIQVKSCDKIGMGYGFGLEKEYENCIILCICAEDKRMWIFPYDDVKNLIKISIGKTKSKYSNYEVKLENIVEKLNSFYEITEKYTFEILDTPINANQQKEQLYRKYRESKIDFIKFENNEMEGLVYDFKVNGKKVQEKLGLVAHNKKGTSFTLNKNYKRENGISYHKNYDIGDNDFYWLHCPDKKYFFVFPEKVLVDREYIGMERQKGIYLNPENDEYYWYYDYMFDYENIDKDRLIALLDYKNEEDNIQNLLENLKI